MQTKEKKNSKIDPVGLDCDQISVSVTTSGLIKFSEPVILHKVALVKKFSGEIVKDLQFDQNSSNTSYKTIDVRRLDRKSVV